MSTIAAFVTGIMTTLHDRLAFLTQAGAVVSLGYGMKMFENLLLAAGPCTVVLLLCMGAAERASG